MVNLLEVSRHALGVSRGRWIAWRYRDVTGVAIIIAKGAAAEKNLRCKVRAEIEAVRNGPG
jgi:hypothetical protein